jgi:hypothetical protein
MVKDKDMEEGRKRVLGIMASILVARHLKTTEDLPDSRPSREPNHWSNQPCSGPSES